MEDDHKTEALNAAAERALTEAAKRRKNDLQNENTTTPTEIGGPKGRDPIRFGDWEKDGIVSDF